MKALPPEEGIETPDREAGGQYDWVKALPPEEGIETFRLLSSLRLCQPVKALPPEEGIETLLPVLWGRLPLG